MDLVIRWLTVLVRIFAILADSPSQNPNEKRHKIVILADSLNQNHTEKASQNCHDWLTVPVRIIMADSPSWNYNEKRHKVYNIG